MMVNTDMKNAAFVSKEDATILKSKQHVNTEIKNIQPCFVCGLLTSYACKRCKMTMYCGQECQKKDWSCHKNYCIDVVNLMPNFSAETRNEFIRRLLPTAKTIGWDHWDDTKRKMYIDNSIDLIEKGLLTNYIASNDKYPFKKPQQSLKQPTEKDLEKTLVVVRKLHHLPTRAEIFSEFGIDNGPDVGCPEDDIDYEPEITDNMLFLKSINRNINLLNSRKNIKTMPNTLITRVENNNNQTEKNVQRKRFQPGWVVFHQSSIFFDKQEHELGLEEYEQIKEFESHIREMQERSMKRHPLWDYFVTGCGTNLYEFWNQEYIVSLARYLIKRCDILKAGYRYDKEDLDHAEKQNVKVQDGYSVVELAAGNGRLSYFLNREFEKLDSPIKILATDAVNINKQKPFPVEIISYQDALIKYKPKIVLCSWMYPGTDWSAHFRKCESLQEYILIGTPSAELVGKTWETWGISQLTPKMTGPAPFILDGFDDVMLDFSKYQICIQDNPGGDQWFQSRTTSFRRVTKN